MNRLTKDLEDAALDWASHEFENRGIGGITEFNRLFTRKFAELIIRECVQQLDKEHAYKIIEYFGVNDDY